MFPNAFLTDRLLLRHIKPDDAHAAFDAYASDPDVARFLTWHPHLSPSETAAYIAAAVIAPRSRTYVLISHHNGTICGAVELRKPAKHCLEVGFLLARSAWGQGLMTEALRGVVRWAAPHPNICRIAGFCDTANLASARVMEKAGLVCEGLLRRWAVHPNFGPKPRDCFSYARVRPSFSPRIQPPLALKDSQLAVDAAIHALSNPPARSLHP